MLSRLRSAWRRARSLPVVGAFLRSADRIWWSRTIRRSDLIDAEFVSLQLGRRVSTRGAVRAYVSGGFRTGLTLNPLFTERLVSSQLPDAERVPALYAYLVTDPARIETSLAWDAPAYAAAHSTDLVGGPLVHAWRALSSGADVELRGGRAANLAELRAATATIPEGGVADNLGPVTASLIWQLDEDDEDGKGLEAPLALASEPGESRAEPPVLVLVVPPAARASTRIMASHLALGCPAIHVTPSVPELVSPDALVVHRVAGALISSPALAAVLTAAEDGPVAPLWLSSDGTVASAGLLPHDGRLYRALAGHPAEDARALGTELTVSMLDAPIRAQRNGDKRAPRILLGETVTAEAAVLSTRRPVDLRADPLPVPEPRGLRLSSWMCSAPRYERTAESFRLPDGSEIPRLRWAIKTAAPAGVRGESWGETHFARALAAALERLGQYVAVDARPALMRSTSDLDDVVLALRGPHPLLPPNAPHTLLWIISHPDEITAAETAAYDRVFAASESWARAASARFGVEVQPLLQCTDVTRFRPSGIPHGRDLVFVGTARGIARPSVVEPIRAGAPVRVYGPDWRGYIPGRAIAGTHVDNDDLPRLYESAGAVLNDHWPAMRREGFVSNRLFDVVAAGGRAISDDVAGIAELFGGAVRTYSDTAELTRLVTQELSMLFPDDTALRRIGLRIRAEHSFDARAEELLRAVIAARGAATA